MIQLFEQDIKTNDRQSSKGNQLKWKNNNIWYKADYTGYEGLSEYIISHLLTMSTLSKDEYVLYDLEKIQYKDVIYNCVKSSDFLNDGWQIITLERLFQNFFNESLYSSLYKMRNYEDRMLFLTHQAERITGLKYFGVYMNKLFTIDALFLNEDRHTHNIAVLMNEDGRFAYCPIFDNGAGLLSDLSMDYPLDGDIYQQMNGVKAKTICDDFDEQLDISEKLYHQNIKFSFTKKDVKKLLDATGAYPEGIRNRVEKILYLQMEKYQYLFDTKNHFVL
ncbi:MAG: hypothetical protein ACI4GW_03655 [Lachnospiraceae bacterium]